MRILTTMHPVYPRFVKKSNRHTCDLDVSLEPAGGRKFVNSSEPNTMRGCRSGWFATDRVRC